MLFQALLAEKVLNATGSNPEDIAKSLLLQSALANAGVTPDIIAAALNELLNGDDIDLPSLVSALRRKLMENGGSGISQDDIAQAVAVVRAMEAGKIRGLKNVVSALEKAKITSPKDLIDLLKKAFADGDLDPETLARAVLAQKVLGALGADPETLAKTVALQKALAESGMPKHEIANAMSLALALGGGADEESDAVIDDLQGLLEGKALSREDIEAILALTKAVHDGSGGEVPPETLRLLKKAMKQRRGSVENVAETLMSTLAASGESQENIAKAMVRALKATGASPEEIARTMGQAMEKAGASTEDIARSLAAAMADSGASSESFIFLYVT